MIFLFSTLIVYNSHPVQNLTALSKLLQLKFIHRFYPGKEFGHVSKILAKTYKGSLTELPKRIENYIDITPQAKIVLAYMSYVFKHRAIFYYKIKNDPEKFYMHIQNIPEKANLPASIAREGAFNGVISKKVTTLITAKTPEEDSVLFRVIFDEGIPIHPLIKLYIAERLHIQPNCSRGFIHSIFVDSAIAATKDPQHIKNIYNIFVENPGGPGDINFALELSRNSEHFNFLTKNMPATFQVKSLTLLHKNIPSSFDAQQSLLRTGQVNCDSRFDVINNDVTQKIYLDTKQTGSSQLDMECNYLKITYHIPSSNYAADDEILRQYIRKSLLLFSKQTIMTKELDSIIGILKSDHDTLYKVNEIHKFVVMNYDKPFGKMAVILHQEINTSEYHYSKIKVIEIEDCNEFTSQAFSIQQKMLFREIYAKFESSSSGNKLQTRVSKENLDHLQAWFKPKHLSDDNDIF